MRSENCDNNTDIVRLKITVPVVHPEELPAGHIFYTYMTNKISRTIAEQIDLLKSRGMSIKDEQKATFYLGHISYYRLKGYWWDMQTDFTNHIFNQNARFEDVIERYNFDRQLRIILFDAIEFIEIALRTKLIYHLSQAYGGLWYLNETLFENIDLHSKHIEELKNEFARSCEIFATDFKRKYPTENADQKIWQSNEKPDAWIIFGWCCRKYAF